MERPLPVAGTVGRAFCSVNIDGIGTQRALALAIKDSAWNQATVNPAAMASIARPAIDAE
jgi:hypothetical protein